MPRPELRLLVTCEHGGHRIPRAYARHFRGQQRLLASHRGWDPGALDVARALARALRAPLVAATTSRLLVDPNRSPHNPAVFSAITRKLPRAERRAILARHHAPHRARVREAIARLAAGRRAPVLHVAVHSFTPVWKGAARPIDLALLYDPARARERAFAAAWLQHLRAVAPALRLRRNAPYRGDSDGLTTALRRELPASRYLGIELELNQRGLSPAGRRSLVPLLATSLRARTEW